MREKIYHKIEKFGVETGPQKVDRTDNARDIKPPLGAKLRGCLIRKNRMERTNTADCAQL